MFGEELVSCLFSREWTARETALRRLSKDVAAALMHRRGENMAVFRACCSLLAMMCGDPVYRVFYAAVVSVLFKLFAALLEYARSENREAIRFRLSTRCKSRPLKVISPIQD